MLVHSVSMASFVVPHSTGGRCGRGAQRDRSDPADKSNQVPAPRAHFVVSARTDPSQGCGLNVALGSCTSEVRGRPPAAPKSSAATGAPAVERVFAIQRGIAVVGVVLKPGLKLGAAPVHLGRPVIAAERSDHPMDEKVCTD